MSYSLAASPLGRRVGITAVSSGTGQQILLTVAPKLWRGETNKIHVLRDLPRRHVELTMFEGDRLHRRSPVGGGVKGLTTLATGMRAVQASGERR